MLLLLLLRCSISLINRSCSARSSLEKLLIKASAVLELFGDVVGAVMPETLLTDGAASKAAKTSSAVFPDGLRSGGLLLLPYRDPKRSGGEEETLAAVVLLA